MANKKYVSLSKLSTFLDNLKAKFALKTHTHTKSEIADLVIDKELSSTSSNPVENKVLDAEFEAISHALSIYDLALNDKADKEHNHDDEYYTQIQVDEKLATKLSFTEEQKLTDEQKLQARTKQEQIYCAIAIEEVL